MNALQNMMGAASLNLQVAKPIEEIQSNGKSFSQTSVCVAHGGNKEKKGRGQGNKANQSWL